jgi:hypothetical protein
MRASTLLSALAAAICLLSGASAQLPSAATPVPLGRCQPFAMMGGSEITAGGAGTVVHRGSIAVSPSASITGNIKVEDGTIEQNTTPAKDCAVDEIIAYRDAQRATCTTRLTNFDLSGRTLYPGVYCASQILRLTSGSVTLDALGDLNAQWIFQASSSLITGTATSVVLANGANANNVFWQVTSSATLGPQSTFQGIILAYASITVNTYVTVTGRLFVQAAVTLAGGDQVTQPAKVTSIDTTPVYGSTGVAQPLLAIQLDTDAVAAAIAEARADVADTASSAN